MDRTSCDQKREVFILRLWRTPNGKSWRGQIQNVLTGQVSAIRDADELRTCLERQTEPFKDLKQPSGLK